MKKIPSTEDIAELGVAVHDHGFQANEHRLVEIAHLTRQVRPDWPIADVVADRAYPEVVRARALGRLAAEWPSIRRELDDFQTRFEADLTELLTTWNGHQQLRREHAAVADLAASRSRLDAIRTGMGRYRRAVSR